MYLYVIPPELQECGESSLHFAEQQVEEGQLSHTILIQQGAQTWQKNVTLLFNISTNKNSTAFCNYMFMTKPNSQKMTGWIWLYKKGKIRCLALVTDCALVNVNHDHFMASHEAN